MKHPLLKMKQNRKIDFGIIVVLTLVLSLLTVFTTFAKSMIFNLVVMLLVPSVFVYMFRKKRWQFLILGILVTYAVNASVLLFTEEYFISKNSRLIIGKVIKKEITFRDQYYIHYTYTHNDYSNTIATKVGRNIFDNIDGRVLIKVSQKRPWYHKVIYSADNNRRIEDLIEEK